MTFGKGPIPRAQLTSVVSRSICVKIDRRSSNQAFRASPRPQQPGHDGGDGAVERQLNMTAIARSIETEGGRPTPPRRLPGKWASDTGQGKGYYSASRSRPSWLCKAALRTKGPFTGTAGDRHTPPLVRASEGNTGRQGYTMPTKTVIGWSPLEGGRTRRTVIDHASPLVSNHDDGFALTLPRA